MIPEIRQNWINLYVDIWNTVSDMRIGVLRMNQIQCQE